MIDPWDILGWILVALVGYLTLVVAVAGFIIIIMTAALSKPKKKDKSTHILGGDRG